MAKVITRDLLESHLNCRYKSHLKLAAQRGIKSDYEEFLDASRMEVKRKAISKILALHPAGEVPRSISLTAAALQLGPSFVLDATLDDDQVSLVFDGLKRVDGPSNVGDFHYIPMLFVEGRQIRKEQRLLMDLYGMFLSRLQAIPT